MRKNPFAISLLLLFFASGLSCHAVYRSQSLHYSSYQINPSDPPDSAFLNFLAPYRNRVSQTMNTVVGTVETRLEKKQPEGSLGDFMADALWIMAAEKYGTKVDAAFVNYGGIRLNDLPPGDVTTGKIFELMPFDNLLVLQKLKGDVLQQLLDFCASRGGWPVAGISMQIKNKKAVNVQVGGKPLDSNEMYTIANSDYVANGGDNADMLRPVPQTRNGYLMRDALFDYIKKRKEQGKNIVVTIENRVTNVE